MATLDYLISIHGGSIVFDKEDIVANHYEQQKLQVEKNYGQSRLKLLQQQLASLTTGLRNRFDLNYAGYIKEKTDYEIDIFDTLRRRVDAIIEKNTISTRDEHNDIGAMLHYYQKVAGDEARIQKLKKLFFDFSELTRGQGYSEVIGNVQKDGIGDVTVKLSSGPKSNNLQERVAVSPDGKRSLRVTQWKDGHFVSTYVSIMFPTASGAIYGISGLHPDVKASWKDNSTIVIEIPKEPRPNTQYHEVRSFDDTISIEYLEHW